MENHSENLIEIRSALELAYSHLKKGDYMKAYYELDMASIGVTVAKMRVLKEQQKQQQNEKENSN